MRVLVTGASGFLGRAVVKKLIGNGHHVTGTSTNGKPLLDLVPSGASAGTLEWIAWKAENSSQPDVDMEEIDGIIHLAISRSGKSVLDSASVMSNLGVTAPLAFLDRVRMDRIPVVLAGSGDCVAAGPQVASETDINVAPLNYYGACKGAMELLARIHWEAGLPVSVVRPVHPYGPGGDAFLINRLAERIRGNETITIEGENGILTNPVWIDDAANGFVMALEQRASGLFQLGSSEVIGLRTIIEKLSSLLGISSHINPVDRHPPGGHAGYTDLARSQLGWLPTVEIDEGLSHLVKNLQLRT
jgi:UDP-glucose 4-epimerase